jgi:hypothetical protein
MDRPWASISTATSSRCTATCFGASTPTRTLSFWIRTMVTTISSPMRILSPTLRVRTSMDTITSSLQAVRMARLLYDAGKPLEDYCDRDLAIRQKLRLYRAALEGRLTAIDLGFCKVLLEKARTSW